MEKEFKYKNIQELMPGDILVKKDGEECELKNEIESFDSSQGGKKRVYFEFFGFNVERKVIKDIFESRDGRVLVKLPKKDDLI